MPGAKRWLAAILLLACAARAEEAITLRVMTFNVWYGGDQVSLEKVGEAIRAADADIVGVQEADGNLESIARAAGMPYVDPRRRVFSRWPIFDSGGGERTQLGPSPYSTTALDTDALHAWVMVRPGKVVAIANVHLSNAPSGIAIARKGGKLADVLDVENRSRVTEAKPLAALAKTASDGTPVFLTGDFNSPSHLDWTDGARLARSEIPYPIVWPTTQLLAQAGLRDSYREAHPDPAKNPGFTWSPGAPHPAPPSSSGRDRIDYVLSAGRATVLASQVVGEAGGPDVEVAVMPWPSDHRAVVSTFRVVPSPAPPLISVVPRRVEEGDAFMLRTYDPTGDAWTGLIVRRGGAPQDAITGVRSLPNAYQRAMPLSTRGMPPGNYDALLVGRGGRVLKRSAFTVAEQGSRPEVRAAHPKPPRGSSLRVRWRNAPGDLRDWIGLYAAGEPDVTRYLGFVYTEAMFDGEAVVEPAPEYQPLPAGRYELRLMHDETFVMLASDSFEVSP